MCTLSKVRAISSLSGTNSGARRASPPELACEDRLGRGGEGDDNSKSIVSSGKIEERCDFGARRDSPLELACDNRLGGGGDGDDRSKLSVEIAK